MNLTLEQKISQMFITGFTGDYKDNKSFCSLLKNGLGGVIFFSYNIKYKKQIKTLVSELKQKALIPMFYSIDQEGGRVERTENIHGGRKYLSAKYAFENGIDFLKKQTKEISHELKEYGINLNFAPVLDVNTNDKNPIIGERAFSSVTEDVIEASTVVLKEYETEEIITTGKHFPGHGAASADSHKTLPVIDLTYEELENVHIRPFKSAIENNMPAVMVAHVVYPCIDAKNPASVSEKIINDILIKKLGFKGVIITDDMEMNGIKGMSRFEACKKAINAGVSMFIYRDTDEGILKLIKDIADAVRRGEISEEKTDAALKKIIDLKYRYGIIEKV